MDAMPPPADSMEMPGKTGASGWPTVVGIIAIIFGALGLLNSCAGVAGTFLMEWISGVLTDMGMGTEATGFAKTLRPFFSTMAPASSRNTSPAR